MRFPFPLLLLSLCLACKPQGGSDASASAERSLDSLEAMEAVPPEVLSGPYRITRTELDGRGTRIEVREIGKDSLLLRTVVLDLPLDDEPFAQFASGALYVVARMVSGNAGQGGMGLWRMPVGGAPVRLADAAPGMRFWVSASGRRTVLEGGSQDTGASLFLLGLDGAVLGRKAPHELGQEPPDQAVLGENGLYLENGAHLRLWDFRNDALVGMAWPEGIGADHAIQPDRGLMAGSTFPDPDTETEEEADAEVVLQVVDLKTGQRSEIARSQAQAFEPRWIRPDTLEFADPATGARTRRFVPRVGG